MKMLLVKMGLVLLIFVVTLASCSSVPKIKRKTIWTTDQSEAFSEIMQKFGWRPLDGMSVLFSLFLLFMFTLD